MTKNRDVTPDITRLDAPRNMAIRRSHISDRRWGLSYPNFAQHLITLQFALPKTRADPPMVRWRDFEFVTTWMDDDEDGA